MPTTHDITRWKGQKAVGTNDDKLGTIDDIYVDERTGEPEWLALRTGLFGSRVSFVPITEAEQRGDDIYVPYSKDQVKDSPNADADGALSQDEESRLYAHYGLDYGEHRSDTGLPEGRDDRGDRIGREGVTGAGAELRDTDLDRTTDRGVVGNDVSGPETDDAMTRSEEEVSVGKREVETGRARLRKYIVTENVTETVPVQREEVRLEREPITDANRDAALSGGDLTEEEHEVTLHAEEAVVEKRVIPKERVRLDRDTVTEEEQVSEEVRKERIEADGLDEASRPGR
jgi:uncharacterized protein (TIGR02271 family)